MDILIDPKPWKSFQSRLGFELAELILDTHMNKAQIDTLISSIIHCRVLEPDSFTLKNEGPGEKTNCYLSNPLIFFSDSPQ